MDPEELKEFLANEELLKEFDYDSRYFMANPTKICRRCKRCGHFEKLCPNEFIEYKVLCDFCLDANHRNIDCQ